MSPKHFTNVLIVMCLQVLCGCQSEMQRSAENGKVFHPATMPSAELVTYLESLNSSNSNALTIHTSIGAGQPTVELRGGNLQKFPTFNGCIFNAPFMLDDVDTSSPVLFLDCTFNGLEIRNCHLNAAVSFSNCKFSTTQPVFQNDTFGDFSLSTSAPTPALVLDFEKCTFGSIDFQGLDCSSVTINQSTVNGDANFADLHCVKLLVITKSVLTGFTSLRRARIPYGDFTATTFGYETDLKNLSMLAGKNPPLLPPLIMTDTAFNGLLQLNTEQAMRITAIDAGSIDKIESALRASGNTEAQLILNAKKRQLPSTRLLSHITRLLLFPATVLEWILQRLEAHWVALGLWLVFFIAVRICFGRAWPSPSQAQKWRTISKFALNACIGGFSAALLLVLLNIALPITDMLRH